LTIHSFEQNVTCATEDWIR